MPHPADSRAPALGRSWQSGHLLMKLPGRCNVLQLLLLAAAIGAAVARPVPELAQPDFKLYHTM